MNRKATIKYDLECAFVQLIEQGNIPFATMLYGSQNYGCDTETSDIDIKAMTLPSLRQIAYNQKPKSKEYQMRDGLCDAKDVRAMFEMYKKQNINFLETLFTKWTFVAPEYQSYWDELQQWRERIARCNETAGYNCFMGMAKNKFDDIIRPTPSQVDVIAKYGYASKQLIHLMRLDYMLDEYIKGEKSYEEMLMPPQSLRDEMISLKTYETVLTQTKAYERASCLYTSIKIRCKKQLSKKCRIDNECFDFLKDLQYRLIKASIKSELAGEENE